LIVGGKHVEELSLEVSTDTGNIVDTVPIRKFLRAGRRRLISNTTTSCASYVVLKLQAPLAWSTRKWWPSGGSWFSTDDMGIGSSFSNILGLNSSMAFQTNEYPVGS